MAARKPPVIKATVAKITTLFVYRKITDLLNISGLDKNKDFVKQIMDVQFQIYMLDSYLESQWELNKKDIKALWKAIRDSLTKMGYKKDKIGEMVSEISDYEKIEANCRKDKWPTKESMKKFYVTKSCDVRLIRHLIYKAHPALADTWKENAWQYYDIITEINDDIADVREDVNTFNGNRFLISLLRKGADKTHKEYLDYLADVTADAAKYFSEKLERGQNKQLAAWTETRSRETAKLLDAASTKKVIDHLSGAVLLSHMK